MKKSRSRASSLVVPRLPHDLGDMKTGIRESSQDLESELRATTLALESKLQENARLTQQNEAFMRHFEVGVIVTTGTGCVTVVNDMTADLLGIPREKVTSQIPPTVVASLIGSQYYYIKHAHPVSVIAYLAVVEGNPPKKAALDDITLKKGIPKKALRTLYKHAELDIVHSKELWALIDDLPLVPWHTILLGINAILVTDQIASRMEEVLASVSRE